MSTLPSGYHFGRYCDGGQEIHHARSEAWHIGHYTPILFTWPNQGDPIPKDWKEWRKALSVSFCGGQDRKLATPMGSWSDKQSDKWRTLNDYIAWQRSTMKFAPNSSRLITGYYKETIAFSLGR